MLGQDNGVQGGGSAGYPEIAAALSYSAGPCLMDTHERKERFARLSVTRSVRTVCPCVPSRRAPLKEALLPAWGTTKVAQVAWRA